MTQSFKTSRRKWPPENTVGTEKYCLDLVLWLSLLKLDQAMEGVRVREALFERLGSGGLSGLYLKKCQWKFFPRCKTPEKS